VKSGPESLTSGLLFSMGYPFHDSAQETMACFEASGNPNLPMVSLVTQNPVTGLCVSCRHFSSP